MANALVRCEKEFGLFNSFWLEDAQFTSISTEEKVKCKRIIVRNIYNFDAMLIYMQFHYDVLHSKDNFIPPAGLIKLIDKFCFSTSHFECIPDVIFKGIQKYRSNVAKDIDDFRNENGESYTINGWDHVQWAEKQRGA